MAAVTGMIQANAVLSGGRGTNLVLWSGATFSSTGGDLSSPPTALPWSGSGYFDMTGMNYPAMVSVAQGTSAVVYAAFGNSNIYRIFAGADEH